MSNYPPRHHPVYMLQDALDLLGATTEFARDERTGKLWGLVVNGRAVAWLIDVRWPHEREHEDPAAKWLMENGGLVCCAQKRDAERLEAKWLPLAASPGYEPKPMPKQWDVGFVGYVRDEARASVLSDVGAHFSVSVAQGVFGDAAVDTYRKARVGLNVPTRYGDVNAYDVPMRVWEILATGVPLVTNWLPELGELGLIPRVDYVPYNNIPEALAAVKYAIKYPEIGERGAALAADEHTYKHRAATVLQWLGEK